ncbi:Catabolite control protein A [Frondihabitans sp. 762G35]|uniref:LacI family DNA-binding transcriptional regulator n=1 Tax=Frondihabitans sp. 762G35 TaxID=1446794 RepID=UPI000D205BF5|nr:LacI family DNA-binding transcriptional regulator [Frondihabitans sp. 762G35]ARC56142.1 Catabolite control protein A [Frondihabitans sp. 762G35]
MTTVAPAPGAGHRTTLDAVAKVAGVSIGTVSKVVNGRSGVGDDTRERVQHAIGQLGYVSIGERQRGAHDRGEVSVELLVDSRDIGNPYVSTFLQGVMDAAGMFDVGVTLRNLTGVEKRDPVGWAQKLARAGRSGVIELTSAYSAPRARALRAVAMPMVLVDPIDSPRTSTPSIGATNWQGAYQATRHLLDLGHRNIRYIGGPEGAACDIVRAHGWAAAMAESGITVDATTVPRHSYTFEHGLAAATALLTGGDRPTAIFAGSDVSAMGVLEAARRMGLTVPEDLSVVGFDDTHIAAIATPPLTTVHQPIADIGRTALFTLLRLARGETLVTKRTELSTDLVIRASTAPPHDSNPA